MSVEGPERFTGGCLFGSVRIVASGRPYRVGVCHCLDWGAGGSRVKTYGSATTPLRRALARGSAPTAALHATKVRALRARRLTHEEIARRLDIGESSVRRILAGKPPSGRAAKPGGRPPL